jgi:superfamily II DNA or RNA helicase
VGGDGLRGWDYRSIYEASANDLIGDFFVPSLRRAARYDRAAGYFRSSIFNLVAVAVSDFVIRGGRMRLICSPSLSDEDEQVIRRLGVQPDSVERSLTVDLEAALEDAEQLPVVELLATLISCRALEVRIAYKADEKGIFHSKVGIFHDGVDAVSFEGSANETYMAWQHNEERFKAFCTWRGQAELVAGDSDYFESLWRGERDSLVVKPLPEIPLRLLRQHALPDPEAALERVRLAHSRGRRRAGVRVRQLQDHQLAVKQNWWEQQRGIVDHVTGGGKTVTALAIAREWFERHPDGSLIVVVPSSLLTKQWRRELERELFDLELRCLHVGGDDSTSKWADKLPDFTVRAAVLGRRVVIATMDSAATERFTRRANVGAHTLLIVDEVHKVASRKRRVLMTLAADARLGLSATPERFGDPSGTAMIIDYFGPRLPPPFGIREAQASKPPRLVPYLYYPRVVSLDALEREEHAKLSREIAVLVARQKAGDSSVTPERLRLRLLRRARILKGAASKVPLAVSLLDQTYERGERWLVYCDDTDQLNAVREGLSARGHDSMVYLSEMAFSKPDTLERFEEIGGILLAVKCLDEGVDIPVVSHALILASSLNPREHLQRRGRVLRASAGKTRAVVYDALVGPDDSMADVVFGQELTRAESFASDARNAREALWFLESLQSSSDRSPAVSDDIEDD